LNIEYYGKLQKTKIYQQLELFKILKRSTFYKISMKQETYEDLNHYNKILKKQIVKFGIEQNGNSGSIITLDFLLQIV